MDQPSDCPVTLRADGSDPSDDEYHAGTGTYRLRFDPGEREATDAVLTAVATCSGRDELALPPLYSVVDPDALDALFAPRTADRTPAGTVAFEYAGCRVTVESGGAVAVEPVTANSSEKR